MNIISGLARNIELTTPPGDEVRPTVGRARKALFDSLGSFDGLGVLDLFSGSGALALEAASRGAAWIVMVESSPDHVRCIEENCRRVGRTGVDCSKLILNFDVMNFERYLPRLPGKPDVIFADPPYARSAEYFTGLLGSEKFRNVLDGALLVWEIPDTPGESGKFLRPAGLAECRLRRFGSTMFLLGRIA